MRSFSALALTICVGLGGCDTPPDAAPEEPTDADAETGSFLVGKADGGCVDPDSAVAQGILSLVNDPGITLAELDDPVASGGAGLYRTAAEGLVGGRPFATLSEIDAVPYVGPHACRALARHACNVEQRCTQPLSLMTWNLRHFPLTAQTEDAVVATLTEFAPDFVGIQEVQDPAALARVADRLPDFEAYTAQQGPYSGVAALVRTSVLDVHDAQDLFDDDWFAFPRPMLALAVDVVGSASQTRMQLGVVHLKAQSDAQSQERRRAASRQLRAWFDSHPEDAHAVVLGDFNDNVTDSPADNVFAALLDDDAGVTFLTEPAESSGAATYIPWSRMLDHVVVTDGLRAHHVDTDVLALDQDADYERQVSDHRPVLSVFAFPIAYPG
ncbi:MAG: endonuclease/exonuclease/phosphatase family protein [Nannocystaceae bacterium]|nr:endonuclease/exonuclease/phosphatase family protein [Nannocystaceae bacterium]